MARLTEEQKRNILAEWEVGTSQNELAKKYRVSPATINKYCKGKKQRFKEQVNTVASVKCEVARESKYLSECFDQEVNRQARQLGLIHDVAELALTRSMQMLQANKKQVMLKTAVMMDGKKIDEQYTPYEVQLEAQDIKHLVEATDKVSLTVGINERHAPKIDLTQNQAQQIEAPTINIILDEG